jgi:hypothetical protein
MKDVLHRLLPLLLVVAVSAGCTTRAGKLTVLEVGMTQKEVKRAFGTPDSVRLGGIGKSGEEAVEVWEYHLYDRGRDRGLSAVFGLGNPNVDYWLYFEDGLLYRWNRAGEQPVLPVK